MKNKFLNFGLTAIAVSLLSLLVFWGCNKDREMPRLEYKFDVEMEEISEQRERGIDEEIAMRFKITPAYKFSNYYTNDPSDYSYDCQVEVTDDNGKQLRNVELAVSNGDGQYAVTPFKKFDAKNGLRLYFRTKTAGVNKITITFSNRKGYEVKKTLTLTYVEYPFDVEMTSSINGNLYQGQEAKHTLRLNTKGNKSSERYFIMFSDDVVTPSHENTIFKYNGSEVLKNVWIELSDIRNIPLSLNSWIAGNITFKMKMKNSTTEREFEIHQPFKQRKIAIEKAFFDKQEVFNRNEKATLSLLVTKEPMEILEIGEENDREKVEKINEVWVKTNTRENVLNRMDSFQRKFLFNQERLDVDFTIQNSGILDKNNFEVEIRDAYGNVATKKLDGTFSYRDYNFEVEIVNKYDVQNNTYTERSPVGIQYKIITTEAQNNVNREDINTKVRYFVTFEGDFQRREQLYIKEDNKKVARNWLLVNGSLSRISSNEDLWFEPQKVGNNSTRRLVLKFLQIVDGRNETRNIEKRVELNIPLGNPQYTMTMSSPTLSNAGYNATFPPYQWIDVQVNVSKNSTNVHGGQYLYLTFNGQIEFKEVNSGYIYRGSNNERLSLGRVDGTLTKHLQVRWVPRSNGQEDLHNREGVEKVYLRGIVFSREARDVNVAKAELEFNAKTPFMITQIEHKSNAWKCSGGSFWEKNRWQEQIELYIKREHIKMPKGRDLNDYKITIYNVEENGNPDESLIDKMSLQDFVNKNSSIYSSSCSKNNRDFPKKAKNQFVIEVHKEDRLVWRYSSHWHYAYTEPQNYFFKKERPINPTINPEP